MDPAEGKVEHLGGLTGRPSEVGRVISIAIVGGHHRVALLDGVGETHRTTISDGAPEPARADAVEAAIPCRSRRQPDLITNFRTGFRARDHLNTTERLCDGQVALRDAHTAAE